MNQAFLWVSGWSVPAKIWELFYKAWPNAKHYSFSFDACTKEAEIIDQAIDVFQQIDAPSINVVGWSLGAMVALELGSRFPSKINHLFLIAGVAKFISSDRMGLGWDVRVLRQMKIRLKTNLPEVIHSFDLKMFTQEEQQTGYLSSWNEAFRNKYPNIPSLQAGLDFLQHFTFSSPEYVKMPISLLAGDQDQICPSDLTQDLAQQLPYSKFTLWENSGHASFWTKREAFLQWMHEELNQ